LELEKLPVLAIYCQRQGERATRIVASLLRITLSFKTRDLNISITMTNKHAN